MWYLIITILCGIIAIIVYTRKYEFIISHHAIQRMDERGVPRDQMLYVAQNGTNRGGKRGCEKRCKDGVCVVIIPFSIVHKRTILTTYFDK